MEDFAVFIDALIAELAACRTINGSAWTDEWDLRLTARWKELGGSLAMLPVAGDLTTADFMRADTRSGPRGIIGLVAAADAAPLTLDQFDDAMRRIEETPDWPSRS